MKSSAKTFLSNPSTLVRHALLGGVRPDPMLTVSQWADKHRRLSQKSSSESGAWRTSRTPYLKEPMDCLSPSSLIERTIFMKGAQVGGTEGGNNWIGYVIDYAPGPMMIVMPTVDTAKRNSKNRIAPLIDESPRLSQKVKTSRSRDSGNTVLQKEFPGGVLVMTGANSAVGLRSQPIKYLMLDEIDGYPGDVDDEGDPVTLAIARTRTFSRRKIYMVSTPTVEGMSKISVAFEDSDQRYYHVPCPHCRHSQVLKWSGVVWPEGEPHKAVYVCEECKKEIQEHHKTKMLAAGKWIPKRPGAGNGKVAGFHLSALYSPLGWFSWGECAELWEQAKKNPAMLRGFINTILGETWKEKGDAPEWERLYHRRETYARDGAIVPRAVGFLTMGIDVQKDRIEYEVVGWARGKESWSIEYGVLSGETATEEPWRKLDEVLHQEFPREQGGFLPIRFAAVDSSAFTQTVYAWARKHSITKVVPIKGFDSLAIPVGRPSAVDVKINGRKIKRGIRMFPVGVSILKSELYSWLRLEKPTDPNEPYPPGYCHFPEYDEEYFKMLTAEELVIKVRKGYRKYEWQKIRERNEALDIRVYARAAASMVGIDRFTEKHWADMGAEQTVTSVANAQAPINKAAPSSAQKKPSGKIERRKSKFL